MPTLVVTTSESQETALEGDVGMTVKEIIRDAGFDELLALSGCCCCCSCATCHIWVDPVIMDLLPALSGDEDDLLDSSDHRTQNSRLSCKLAFSAELDGLTVTIAPEDRRTLPARHPMRQLWTARAP